MNEPLCLKSLPHVRDPSKKRSCAAHLVKIPQVDGTIEVGTTRSLYSGLFKLVEWVVSGCDEQETCMAEPGGLSVE